jgi:hypothetical protein
MSWSAPDDPTPDSAMASGSDAGEPGGHLGPGDLAPDEERLLAALERDAGRDSTFSVTTPTGSTPTESIPTETIAAVRAAEDEAPLPGKGGPPDDGLNPLFRSPGES